MTGTGTAMTTGPHDEHHHGNPYDHAHESPGIMTWPLLILMVPTIIVGYPWTILPLSNSEVAKPILERMLETGEPLVRSVAEDAVHEAHWLAMGSSVLILAVGVALGLLYYAPPLRYFPRRRFEPKRAAERLGGIHRLLVHKWYFDEIYDAVFVRPCLALARSASGFDRRFIDGIVNSSAWLTVLLSRMEGLFDKLAVDSLVNLSARIVYTTGDWVRGIQTGRLRNYLMFLAIALVGLFVGAFAWVRG